MDQQVDSRRSSLFISYAREDRAFVEELASTLSSDGREVRTDRDIPAGAQWEAEVDAAIEAADVFVFVLTAESVTSEQCARELEQARVSGKRCLPILHKPVEGLPLAPYVASSNWLIEANYRDLVELVQAIRKAADTDLDWLKRHTRWLLRAAEWERNKKESAFLLRGKPLREAEQWIAEDGPDRQPHPSPLQLQYIVASRRGSTRRSTILLAAAILAVLVVAVLGVRAFIESRIALARQFLAQAQVASRGVPSALPISTSLALESQEIQPSIEADSVLRRSMQLLARPKLTVDHPSEISAMAVDAKHGLAATGMSSGAILVWTLTDGKVITRLRHDDIVTAVDFRADGTQLVTASDDKTARIWNTQGGGEVLRLQHDDDVLKVRFSPDGQRIATGTDGGRVTLWDAMNGAKVFDFALAYLRVREIEDLKFSSDGDLLFACSFNGLTEVWDTKTYRRLAHVEEDGPSYALAVNKEGSLFATTSSTGWSGVYVSRTGKLVWRLYNGTESDSVEFGPDGSLLAIGCADNRVRVWNLTMRREERILQVNGATSGLLFDSTGHYLFVMNGTSASLWNLVNGAEVRRTTSKWGIEGAGFLSDGHSIATGSSDGVAHVWDILGGHDLADIYQAETVDSIAFDPLGRFVAVSGDTFVRLWGPQDGKLQTTFQVLGHVADDLDFDNQGERLAVGASDGSVSLWDPVTAKMLSMLPNSSGKMVEAVRFSPTGNLIAAGGWDFAVRFWSLPDGKQVPRRLEHPKAVTSISFSPDGTRIASGCLDGIVRVWDVATGSKIAEFAHGQNAQVWSVAFSPDGRVLVSGSSDDIVRIWDAASFREIVPRTPIRSSAKVVFSRDGKFLATSGVDRAQVWRFSDRQEVARIPHEGTVKAVAFSPDGSYVVSGGDDKRVLFSSLKFDSLRDLACSALTRNLTPEEWATYSQTTPNRRPCPGLP
jgi:WD40 repeat protein